MTSLLSEEATLGRILGIVVRRLRCGVCVRSLQRHKRRRDESPLLTVSRTLKSKNVPQLNPRLWKKWNLNCRQGSDCKWSTVSRARQVEANPLKPPPLCFYLINQISTPAGQMLGRQVELFSYNSEQILNQPELHSPATEPPTLTTKPSLLPRNSEYTWQPPNDSLKTLGEEVVTIQRRIKPAQLIPRHEYVIRHQGNIFLGRAGDKQRSSCCSCG